MAPRRKPLIIRGARQVGKSTLVRQFAQSQGLRLAEINLERHLRMDTVFQSNDPGIILPELETLTDTDLSRDATLLFLDEIQACPHALPALRYFYEDKPALPVIAAGSLLEFLLSEHDFSMPVGRVQYFHLGPLSYMEFLTASGEDRAVDFLEKYSWTQKIPGAMHDKLCRLQREYLFVGGMPEAVIAYAEARSPLAARDVHRSIINTYQDDFAKYKKRRRDPLLMQAVIDAMPRNLGLKVKYANISREDRAIEVKHAIDLLLLSRVLIAAYHSDCSGLPIRAGKNTKTYKLYLLDVGLLNGVAGLEWSAISQLGERELVNAGGLAEQFIAQHIAYRGNGLEAPEIYYWLREGKSDNAETDFVIAANGEIIPLEVKSGKGGSLKSLQQFVLAKKSKRVVRFDLNPPSISGQSHAARDGEKMTHARFQLLSLPLYLVEQLDRLLEDSAPSHAPSAKAT